MFFGRNLATIMLALLLVIRQFLFLAGRANMDFLMICGCFVFMTMAAM